MQNLHPPRSPPPDIGAPPLEKAAPLFGHPRGLMYLAFTEAWERFSFYGMQTLLLLYMVGQLLKPGHVEHVIGFAAFRAALEATFGPMSTLGLASMVFGLYSGLAYLLAVGGGVLGDRVLGQKRCVLAGAVLMAVGHFLMAFEPPFLAALAALVIGSGLLKGNINTQVGRLYAPDDRRRTEAYQLFSIGINVGVVAAPFVCGTLGEVWGWHYGFAAAGLGMVVGLVIYLAGRRHLPPDRVGLRGGERPRLQSGDRRAMLALLVVLVVVTAYLTSIGQTGSIYLVWIKANVDRSAFGRTIPATWFLSVTGFGSMVLPPALLRFWRWQAERGTEPAPLTKVGLGSAAAAGACMILALLSAGAQGGSKIAWPWLLAYHLAVTLGYLYLWPVGMALFSRYAPATVKATFISVFFLASFASNALVGWLGRYYELMSPTAFWIMQGAIGAGGAGLLAVCRPALRRWLAPTRPAEETAAAQGADL